MSNVIRINACLFSRIGYGRGHNATDFYMNGRFQSSPNVDNIQASLENRGSEYLFTLADHMEDTSDPSASVSINKEVARLHEKISVQGGDISYKIKELSSRIGGSVRMLDSILEMNHVPADDDRRQYGFSSLLFSDGNVIAATAGLGHVFLYREEELISIARETTKREKLVRLGVLTEEDAQREDLDTADDEVVEEAVPNPIILSEEISYCENDTFLLISQGAYESLGEERIEDIVANGGDSAEISGRIITEAMKRTSRGDLAAMVVQIEKIYDVQGSARKPMLKSRVDALSKTPAVTYKYNKKPVGRDNVVFIGLFALTIVIILAILITIISSLISPKDPEPAKESSNSPKPSITATATPEPTPEPETTPVVVESTTPEPTPEATPAANPETYTVQKGDTMSGIVRKFYNDVKYLDSFSSYNGVNDPSKIQPGQVLKIPAKEALQ